MGRSAVRDYRILGCWFAELSLFEHCIYASGIFLFLFQLCPSVTVLRLLSLKSHAGGVFICCAIVFIVAIIIGICIVFALLTCSCPRMS